MRYHEIISETRRPRRFFHCSRKTLATGDAIKPSGRLALHPRIETALEQHRPSDMLARNTVVYLAPTMDFNLYGLVGGRFYEVRPVARIEAHDVAWIGQLQRSLKKSDMTFPPIEWLDWNEKNLRYLCSNYWYAEPSEAPVWEYLTPSATVTKVLQTPKDVLESWDHYTQIGHKKGHALVWYLLPGGKLLTHPFTRKKDNHDMDADGPESQSIAVGRIDTKQKKISVRTPLAPGNSFFMLSAAKLDYIRNRLERDYPDYEIWYFGNAATDIRRIDRSAP
jgi:hypothetical protein